MKNKKGLEMKITIELAILAISIAVILFFISQYYWKGQIDKNACHTSVMLKKTMPEAPVAKGKIVDLPLRCETERICFYVKKGECKEFDSLDYEKRKIKDKEELVKQIADLLAEDWSMMGQGKGGVVFSREIASPEKSYTSKGVVASVFAFSDDIKNNKEFQGVDSWELTKFMSFNKLPSDDKITYWQFLLGNEKAPIISPEQGNTFQSIDFSKQYAIVYVEYDKNKLPNILSLSGGAVLGGYLAGAIVGSVVPGIGTVIGAGIIGGAVGAIVGGKAQEKWDELISQGDYYSSIALVPFDREEMLALSIDEFKGFA